MSLAIGVVGFIHSGKGTIGDYLIERYNFKKDSFASPLKDAIANIFGWPRHLLEGDTIESRDWREIPDIWWEEKLNWTKMHFSRSFPRFTPRVCLQLFGTDVLRRAFNDDLWILSLQNRLQKIKSNIVITDCRFPNEVDAIRSQKGIIIRVKRGDEPSWYPIALEANRKHIHNEHFEKMCALGIHHSEWAWIGSKFDYEITNNGTLIDLHNSINIIMENHKNECSKSF